LPIKRIDDSRLTIGPVLHQAELRTNWEQMKAGQPLNGIAERLAQFEQDPKAMAIARQNGLTAQEYLVGVPALCMALMAAQGLSGPNITVSPANLAFAKANLAQLKPKMDAADGIRAKH
jgi:hypothetical protein